MSTLYVDAVTPLSGPNRDLVITGKGVGKVVLGDANLVMPDTDGSPNQILHTDGAGNLDWVDSVEFASQAEAEAGTDNTKSMTPLRVSQAIDELSTLKVVQAQHYESYPGSWTPSTSYATVPGLSVSFTPQRSDTRIKIEMNFTMYQENSDTGISHQKLYVGSTIHRSWSQAATIFEGIVSVTHDVTSWGTYSNNIQIKSRGYSNSGGHNLRFHGSRYFDGSFSNIGGGDSQAHPVVHITEYLEG